MHDIDIQGRERKPKVTQQLPTMSLSPLPNKRCYHTSQKPTCATENGDLLTSPTCVAFRNPGSRSTTFLESMSGARHWPAFLSPCGLKPLFHARQTLPMFLGFAQEFLLFLLPGCFIDISCTANLLQIFSVSKKGIPCVRRCKKFWILRKSRAWMQVGMVQQTRRYRKYPNGQWGVKGRFTRWLEWHVAIMFYRTLSSCIKRHLMKPWVPLSYRNYLVAGTIHRSRGTYEYRGEEMVLHRKAAGIRIPPSSGEGRGTQRCGVLRTAEQVEEQAESFPDSQEITIETRVQNHCTSNSETGVL